MSGPPTEAVPGDLSKSHPLATEEEPVKMDDGGAGLANNNPARTAAAAVEQGHPAPKPKDATRAPTPPAPTGLGAGATSEEPMEDDDPGSGASPLYEDVKASALGLFITPAPPPRKDDKEDKKDDDDDTDDSASKDPRYPDDKFLPPSLKRGQYDYPTDASNSSNDDRDDDSDDDSEYPSEIDLATPLPPKPSSRPTSISSLFLVGRGEDQPPSIPESTPNTILTTVASPEEREEMSAQDVIKSPLVHALLRMPRAQLRKLGWRGGSKDEHVVRLLLEADSLRDVIPAAATGSSTAGDNNPNLQMLVIAFAVAFWGFELTIHFRGKTIPVPAGASVAEAMATLRGTPPGAWLEAVYRRACHHDGIRDARYLQRNARRAHAKMYGRADTAAEEGAPAAAGASKQREGGGGGFNATASTGDGSKAADADGAEAPALKASNKRSLANSADDIAKKKKLRQEQRERSDARIRIKPIPTKTRDEVVRQARAESRDVDEVLLGAWRAWAQEFGVAIAADDGEFNTKVYCFCCRVMLKRHGGLCFFTVCKKRRSELSKIHQCARARMTEIECPRGGHAGTFSQYNLLSNPLPNAAQRGLRAQVFALVCDTCHKEHASDFANKPTGKLHVGVSSPTGDFVFLADAPSWHAIPRDPRWPWDCCVFDGYGALHRTATALMSSLRTREEVEADEKGVAEVPPGAISRQASVAQRRAQKPVLPPPRMVPRRGAAAAAARVAAAAAGEPVEYGEVWVQAGAYFTHLILGPAPSGDESPEGGGRAAGATEEDEEGGEGEEARAAERWVLLLLVLSDRRFRLASLFAGGWHNLTTSMHALRAVMTGMNPELDDHGTRKVQRDLLRKLDVLLAAAQGVLDREAAGISAEDDGGGHDGDGGIDWGTESSEDVRRKATALAVKSGLLAESVACCPYGEWLGPACCEHPHAGLVFLGTRELPGAGDAGPNDNGGEAPAVPEEEPCLVEKDGAAALVDSAAEAEREEEEAAAAAGAGGDGPAAAAAEIEVEDDGLTYDFGCRCCWNNVTVSARFGLVTRDFLRWYLGPVGFAKRWACSGKPPKPLDLIKQEREARNARRSANSRASAKLLGRIHVEVKSAAAAAAAADAVAAGAAAAADPATAATAPATAADAAEAMEEA